MTNLHNILDSIAHPRILVIGDLILDKYTFGNVERVSPEAPVLILRTESKDVRLGGAASVAMLLRVLQAEVTLAGVIGDDPEGRTLLKLLDDEHIDRSMVLLDRDRPTTVKERFVGQCASRSPAGGQQMLRVDHETQTPIGPAFEEWLACETASRLEYPWGRFPNLPVNSSVVEAATCRSEPSPFSILDPPSSPSSRSYDAILISDYAKGVCTERLMQMVMAKAGERRVPVVIDPARIADFDRYSYATLLKPNRFEAELATGRKIVTVDDALAAADELRKLLKVDSVLITLDHDGMAVVAGDFYDPHTSDESPLRLSQHFPVTAREVYDITGAGDMVLATLGLCMASNVPLPQAAQLANIAAGLEVEKLGVAPVTREDLSRTLVEAASCRSRQSPSSILDHPSSAKMTDITSLLPILAAYRSAGKRITFTNGCFDLLHVGHVTMLEEAAALGDILIVAINSDDSARNLKGPGRPVIPEKDRAKLLAALNCVDHVLIFDAPTPHRLLEAIRPDILAKGGTTPEIVGREIVESYGGRAFRLAEVAGYSTTAILAQLDASYVPNDLILK